MLELRHGPVREALAAAQAPLTELGAAVRAECEIVITPGNHDHDLLDPWFERRSRRGPAAALGLESEADHRRGEPLATLAGWLGAGRVRVSYPGVWLRDDVYATHGHYADAHLTMPTLERLAAGVMNRIVGLGVQGPRNAEDYEAILGPIYAWIHSLAQRVDGERGGHLHGGSVRGWQALSGAGRRGPRRQAIAAGYPAAIFALNRLGLGPLRAELSGAALRRAGLRGIEETMTRLGVSAPYVIFGHTHRAGPMLEDDASEWRTATGSQLVNTGCWVQEPSFLGSDPEGSPYRVGFAVWVGDGGPPQLVNLLDAREVRPDFSG